MTKNYGCDSINAKDNLFPVLPVRNTISSGCFFEDLVKILSINQQHLGKEQSRKVFSKLVSPQM